MSKIKKPEYAVAIVDALVKSNTIVNDARNVLYTDFETQYGQALADIDYDDFRYHCLDIPVFVLSSEEEAVEYLTFENPFSYGSYLATDHETINYDNYDFRVEEDYLKFVKDLLTAFIVENSEHHITPELLDLEATTQAMFEENYGLKDFLPSFFISDCVSNELSAIVNNLKAIEQELEDPTHKVDTSLVFKSFDNAIFYESSKCW